MKRLLLLIISIPSILFAQDKRDHHVLLLNGGHDSESNQPRYYENIKSMYDAYRDNHIEQKNISVLYGSGRVEDTDIQTFKFAPLKLEPFGEGLFPPKKPSYFKPNTPVSDPEPKKEESRFSLADLFRGESKELDGEAKKETLKEKIKEIQKKLKPGDDLSLFITDHGDFNKDNKENLINLWGEKITTAELGDLLKDIPETNNIRIITNICYGGGLNELTKKNLCVFANQEKINPSYSQSNDLDLYGQNFAFAMKNKIDFDNDGKATYLDAHDYAASLDNKKNLSVTSLDWFLLKTRSEILALKNSQVPAQAPYCEISNENSLQELSNIIREFSDLKTSLVIDEKIPEERQYLLSTRLQKKLDALKKNEAFSKNETLEFKLNILKTNLEVAATNWDALTPDQQQYHRKRNNLEAQQLKNQIDELISLQNSYKNASLELDLIRYGDKRMIDEYKGIKRCLDYAY